MARLKRIAGYNKVVSTWGCEFRKMLQDNFELEKELNSHPQVNITAPYFCFSVYFIVDLHHFVILHHFVQQVSNFLNLSHT
jgi:hypothetical protein